MAVFVLVASAAAFLVIVPAIWLAGLMIGGGLEVEWAIFPLMILFAVLSFGGIAFAGARLCLRAGLSPVSAGAVGASGPLAGLVIGCAYWASMYALMEWLPVTVSAVVASIGGAALASRRRRATADAPVG
ncbi:hypothetical protein [Promicromonospora sp. NPDC023987]|uniref:hypothetical protein n=1 Tax=Promicromonospora sp. NPDC023987 TaxID=3155360 RepID=UPI0033D59DE1